MKLGIIQHYFFPYPGYFSLIKATDKLIVFDISQYVRHSWMNINRIIDPNSDGYRYITVPVKKHKLRTPINNLGIQNGENWKEKIIAHLGYYRKYAPHYKTVVEFLHATLNIEFENLSELNLHTLKASCAFIDLKFLNFGYKSYDQKRDEFIPGLSIIDAMMFNSPTEINQMLDDYQLVG